MLPLSKLLLLWTVLYFLIFALTILFKPKYMIAIIEKRMKNAELSFLFGMILFVIGLLYLFVYVKLDGTWPMLFSILWYLCLLKGIAMTAFPKFWADKSKIFYGTVTMARVMWSVVLIAAIFILCVALVKF